MQRKLLRLLVISSVALWGVSTHVHAGVFKQESTHTIDLARVQQANQQPKSIRSNNRIESDHRMARSHSSRSGKGRYMQINQEGNMQMMRVGCDDSQGPEDCSFTNTKD